MAGTVSALQAHFFDEVPAFQVEGSLNFKLNVLELNDTSESSGNP